MRFARMLRGESETSLWLTCHQRASFLSLWRENSAIPLVLLFFTTGQHAKEVGLALLDICARKSSHSPLRCISLQCVWAVRSNSPRTDFKNALGESWDAIDLTIACQHASRPFAPAALSHCKGFGSALLGVDL